MKPLVDGFSTKRTVSTRSFACLPTHSRRCVQFCPPLPLGPLENTPSRSRHPMAAPERGPTGPAHPHPPPQRPALHPAHGRFRDRHDHRLPVDHRGRRSPGCPRPHARRSSTGVQVMADPKGRLLWASPALAGAVHDVRAAHEHGIIDALAQAGINCSADKGYQGAGGTVRLPYRGRWDTPSAGQQAVNRSHAKVRALVNRPSPPSSPGGSCASSAARPPESRASSRPSSHSIWPAQAEDGEGSLPPMQCDAPPIARFDGVRKDGRYPRAAPTV